MADFAHFLPQHVLRDRFRMVTALEDRTDEIVGFAYGFASTSDQFFYQEVAKVTHSDFVMAWFSDYFRLVQIAVLPQVQGRGIGSALHDHLLSGLPQAKGILATIAAETNAFQLYRQRGWQVLLQEIFFPGVNRPYQIMGKELVPPELAVS
ncbi:MAG: GNAT family N-acetyltransferase [Ardenticatenaceae bacterium]|nr:GNAT family N-acetyltransferase [Ardenticatenaceae bacterium]